MPDLHTEPLQWPAVLPQDMTGTGSPVDLAALCAHWEQVNVVCQATIPTGLEADPSLGGRVRGALYYQLDEYAAEALYGAVAGQVPAYHGTRTAPRPLALAVRTHGGRLTCRVALFGAARRYSNAVADALPRALASGLALNGLTVVRGSAVPARTRTDIVRPRLPVAFGLDTGRRISACLLLQSPMVLRQGKRSGAGTRLLFNGLALRAEGLAAHMGLRLDDRALEPSAFQAAIGHIAHRFLSAWPEVWRNHSRRQPGTVRRFEGVMGRIEFAGLDATLVRLLAIGEAAQAGGRTAFGCGDYMVAWYP